MNHSSRVVRGAVLVVLAWVVLGGWQILNAREMEHNPQHREAKSEPLHDTMKHMGKLYKQVRGSLKDVSKYAKAADAVAKMEELVVKAKAMMPKKVKKMPADQRTAAMKKYRLDMCALLGNLSQLESALVQGNQAKATAALRACSAVRKKGHRAFREKED